MDKIKPEIDKKLTLPKGGGAISGIGEKFQVNSVTGTGSFSIPVKISPGRNGFGPEFNLAYDSGSGNSSFGLGWQMGVSSISRKTQKGIPQYQDDIESDTYLFSGAEDLIPLLKKNLDEWKKVVREESGYKIFSYLPRTEGLFARIERWFNLDTAISHWRVVTKENVVSIFGSNKSSRITHPDDHRKVFQWLLDKTYDDKGNCILFDYKQEDPINIPHSLSESNRLKEGKAFTNRYLKKVKYGNTIPIDRLTGNFHEEPKWLFEVVLDYGEHGGELPVYEPLYSWGYRKDPFSTYRSGFEIRTYRLCKRILMFHHFKELGTSPYLVASTDINYDNDPVASKVLSIIHRSYEEDKSASLPPVEFKYTEAHIDPDIKDFDTKELDELPGGIDGLQMKWTDLYGEGLTGILVEDTNAWWYKRNISSKEENLTPCFQAFQTVAEKPSLTSNGQQLVDIDGDGCLDLLVQEDGLSGFYEKDINGDWDEFKAFKDIPNINWGDPNLRQVDLTGDGYADLLITEDNCFTWYASKVKDGYALPKSVVKALNEDLGPDLVFSDSTQSIYLADMSGDGLNDILRVRNGELSYWPNMGYGHFGSKIVMENAPFFGHSDLFDQKRIKIGDVDGSGNTDILYISADTVRYWSNQSGNSFSAAKEISHSLPSDNLSNINVIDLLASGTSCIVFSNPNSTEPAGRLRYIDLMSEGKPYLLSEVNNNMGAITRNHYVPSTKFYVEAEKKGKPWISKLPFPVHVLEKKELIDEIENNIFTSRYAYHHGYYDRYEREFRGFGLVEQWDTEDYDSSLSGNNINESSFIPPVYTKTWIHTGFYKEKIKILRQYEHEYYQGDPNSWEFPDIKLPASLKADEVREAHRVLKGSTLRQEVYALDGTEKSIHPYSVTESRYKIRLQQPKLDNQFASFLVIPSETLTYHYERNPLDPRIQHQLTLDVDQYGTVLKSIAIGYPRRQATFPEQGKLILTTEENRVTHLDDQADHYRLGLPIEGKGFEISGVTFAYHPYTVNELNEFLAQAEEIAFEEKTDLSKIQKRLITHQQSSYYDKDLTKELLIGQVAFHALPYAAYEKALTPGLIELAYAGRVTDQILTEGGYVLRDNDWWRPTGKAIFSPQHFYQATESIDPFGNRTQIDYDQYAIFPIASTDALSNNTSAIHDYRVLQAKVVTDINGNQQQVKFDTLGSVIATAIFGKNSEGDTIDDPSSKVEYDLFNWMQNRQPNYTHTMSREEHQNVDTLWQEVFSYSNGLGKEILTKVQAEPGLAFVRNEDGSLKKDLDGNLEKANVEKRWIGNGRTILNNKGKPVKQHEPYFSSTSDYEDEIELREYGVSPITHYDPLERVIRTDLADGTFTKTIFDPWKQAVYDPNDTVLESDWYVQKGAPDPNAAKPNEPEKRAAWLAAQHSNTPQLTHLDTLGRVFLSIEDNGIHGKYETHTELDITGKPIRITDPKGRVLSEETFDMLGNLIVSKKADAGDRWILNSIITEEAENESEEEGEEESLPYMLWDSRAHQFKVHYDALQRPHYTSLTKNNTTQIVNLTVYGESHPEAEQKNLKGQAYLQFDQAGMVKNHAFDFKGNPLTGSRKFAIEYKNTIDWSSLIEITNPITIEETVSSLLQEKEFTTQTSFDALNRPIESIAPDNSVIKHFFNEANLLDKVKVKLKGADEWTSFVDNIDYDEKGQRQSIQYSNGAKTNYYYDPLNYRLTRLHTVRPSDNEKVQSLQDLHYTYDPVGNIAAIRDDAQQTIYFNNAKVNPTAQYEYDALYRLINAEGRELAGLLNQTKQTGEKDISISSLPSTNNTQALRNYRQTYSYDELGNILKMAHQADNGNWTCHYQYAVESNRLLATSLPGDNVSGSYSHKYNHDEHGNMTQMPHLKTMVWDFDDQLKEVDLQGGGKAYYVYDASGQRLRKVIEQLGGSIKERYYIGDLEVYRERMSDVIELERETLHISDDQTRVALVDTKTIEVNNSTLETHHSIRYQLGNHLGSASLELDNKAELISYEEYHPFGTSAYRSGSLEAEVSQKRYRYTGKERDDETGLYYYGARYLATWLGRWTATDPAGFVDGFNVFVYVKSSPINLIDEEGFKSGKPDNYRSRKNYNQVVKSFKNTKVKYTKKQIKKYTIKMNKLDVKIKKMMNPRTSITDTSSSFGRMHSNLKNNKLAGRVVGAGYVIAVVAEAMYKYNQWSNTNEFLKYKKGLYDRVWKKLSKEYYSELKLEPTKDISLSSIEYSVNISRGDFFGQKITPHKNVTVIHKGLSELEMSNLVIRLLGMIIGIKKDYIEAGFEQKKFDLIQKNRDKKISEYIKNISHQDLQKYSLPEQLFPDRFSDKCYPK